MKKNLLRILTAFLIIVFICSSSSVIYYKYKLEKSDKAIEEVRKQVIKNPENIIVEKQPIKEEKEHKEDEENEEKTEELKVLTEYEKLYQENQDLIGWIKIDETNVNYPVMQTKEPKNPIFYDHRSFQKEEDVKGLPLIDSRCNLESENIIIYGHNMKDGTMFGSLKKYKEKSYYEKHPIIQFDTIYEKSQYQIIGVLLSKIYYDNDAPKGEYLYYENIELDSEEQFQEYVNNVKKDSLYDIEETAQYGDKLITLFTCHYHTEDGRLLVVAKNTII